MVPPATSSIPSFSESVRAERVVVDDGVGLAVAVAGDPGHPGLLLVHGFGGAKEDFADHFDAFAVHHRVVTFDHRGHGGSDKPDDPRAYSLDRLATDVQAVALATELRDLRLLGHSMGGMAVRRIVLRDPALAGALVFMDTSPGAPPGIDPALVRVGAEIASMQGMGALKRVQDEIDPFGSPAYRRVVSQRPGFADFAASKWASLSPVMWATLAVEITTQPNQLGALAGIAVPTLVVAGDQDHEFLEPSRSIASTVPGARFVVVPDAGHSPQFENPATWRAAIEDFLADL